MKFLLRTHFCQQICTSVGKCTALAASVGKLLLYTLPPPQKKRSHYTNGQKSHILYFLSKALNSLENFHLNGYTGLHPYSIGNTFKIFRKSYENHKVQVPKVRFLTSQKINFTSFLHLIC